MKRTSPDYLVCPTCHSSLILQSTSGDEVVESGSLTCRSCRRVYPIRDGYPRFIEQSELEGFNKRFAHLYDWFSLIYAAFSKVGLFILGLSEPRARQELIERLQPRGRVLEVSIGPGVNLPYLVKSPAVLDVVGIDISIGQLNRCNALLRRKGWSVDLYLANGEQLPFSDESFDSVFHVGGINFFSNKQNAMDEMIRVAKPGTKIIICDENEAGAKWYERFLPGFKSAFHGQREAITAPVDLVPASMIDLKLGNIWNEFMYCLEFRKPGQ
jgi:ubiquinone/menaquinone biosynthesis C-methylase UbiE/uncharacterized protein YbaR (Trm112 family)